MNKHFQQLLPLYMIIFVSFLGYAMTVALFVPMLMDRASAFLPAATSLHYRTILVGFIVAVYPLGQFFGSPVLGALGDRYGRKKILLTSLVLASFGYLGISISLTFHWLDFLFASLRAVCVCVYIYVVNMVYVYSNIC